MSRPLNLYHTCIYIVICVIVVTHLPLYHKSGNVKRQLCVKTEINLGIKLQKSRKCKDRHLESLGNN